MDLERILLRDMGLTPEHGLNPRELLHTLTKEQDGQFAVRQAVALGLKPSQVRALRDRGDVSVVRRGVGRFETARDPDPAITAFLACWPCAIISHASAARYHGLTRVALPEKAHVTVATSASCRLSDIVVHHARELDDANILRVGTLRYASLALCVCDLSTAGDPWESLSILDDAVALGARQRWVHHVASALVNGRDGVALIEKATRPGAAAEFRSWFERAGAEVFSAAGLPHPQWNVPVYDDRGRIGIVDALWLPHRVVCELKGLRFHGTPTQVSRDDRRLNRLLDAQYSVRNIGWRDFVDTPAEAALTVMRALRAAGAEVDPAAIPRRLTVPACPTTCWR